ncbi:hypothetical protein SAMN05421803_11576 [Nocardiopsis flavescens]|uniref:DUF2637 domain-containing protein n=1 Tax=Nocardiopsis flavescens TaxID=758803 RepID=A0A1M6QI70_9ACTN|nr:hypothetical protein [Nocardiopsis flavescens]SHK20014.1 hypothetical protein SAMN05421803_11576 [Nocardiopsis flavescens]
MTRTDPTTDTTVGKEDVPEQIRQELADRRARVAARKDDRLERFRDRARRAMDARDIRRDLTRDRVAADLERAKLAADISQSAEARALRVQRTRTLTLAALMPVLVAFAGWSTAGVHAGAAAMTGAQPGTAMWWMLWLLEPALIGIVGWIILCRARLESSGGTLPHEADHIMWGALAVSILLNTVGHWPAEFTGTAVGGLLAHSLGPIGAAMTAHLIGVIERGIAAARPTEGPGVKTLAELTADADSNARRTEPGNGEGHAVENTLRPPVVDRSRLPENAFTVPPGAVRLAVVACSRPAPGQTTPAKAGGVPGPAAGTGRRSTVEQGGQQGSETPRKERSDKGRKVPKSATPTAAKPSSRELSDADLMAKLDALIGSGDVPEGVSVRRAMTVLGCGYDRAKRVLTARQERTETTVPGQLSVVDALTAEEAA